MRSAIYLLLGVLVIYAVLWADAKKGRALSAVSTAAAIALLAVFGLHAAQAVEHSLATPPTWDYRAFWVYGRAVDVTHHPYDPVALHQIARGLPVDAGFTREILDVGFVYPPATAPLFAPPGFYASPRRGAPLWYALLCAFLVAQVLLLWRHFLQRDGWNGLLAASLIVALLPTTLAVLSMGQTLFIAEVFLLLYLADRREWRGGTWLALAVVVKPFLAVVVLYPIVQRQWRVLVTTVAVYGIATLLTIPLIGTNSITSFFVHPPEVRQPASVLMSDANQSIVAWMARLHEAPPLVGAALHDPLYIAVAAGLLVLTLWRIAGSRKDLDYGVALLLTVSLLVYPQAMWHYTSMLSIPLCLLWARRNAIPYGAPLAAGFTVLIFFCAHVENAQIFDFILAWTVMFCLPVLERAALRSMPVRNASGIG